MMKRHYKRTVWNENKIIQQVTQHEKESNRLFKIISQSYYGSSVISKWSVGKCWWLVVWDNKSDDMVLLSILNQDKHIFEQRLKVLMKKKQYMAQTNTIFVFSSVFDVDLKIFLFDTKTFLECCCEMWYRMKNV